MSPKKRRLSDLYVTGKEVVLNDGQGEVKVWLRKLSQLEHEAAMRKAAAAKARVLMIRNQPDDEEWLAVYAEIDELGGRSAFVEYVIAEELSQVQESREAELAASEEWSKDHYIQGLRDAWEGDAEAPGLRDRYIEEPDDPEAKKVFGEIKRFTELVDEQVAAERERLIKDLEGVSDEELRSRAVTRYLEIQAGITWVREFQRAQVLYATRDNDDHDKYYFVNQMGKPARAEVDLLAPETLGALKRAYAELEVDPAEGKDSPPPPSSSLPSEEPDEAVTEPSSGPLALVP